MWITKLLYKLSRIRFAGHSEYSKFATNLTKQELDNLTTREQYQKIYKFLKQEESKNKEHTYDFSKRFIENAKSREKQSDIHISTIYGFVIGIIGGALLQTDIFKNLLNFNSMLNIIITCISCVAFILLVGLSVLWDAQKILFTDKMTNLPIILTVLEDYCEEVETTFR